MTLISSVRNRLRDLRTSSTKTRTRLALGLVSLVFCVVTMAAGWNNWQGSAEKPKALASVVPQGALLTIESKDFASLLKQWNDSREKAAWLQSDDYEGFSRSKLFGRLGDAQTEFARSAGLPPDMSFVQEVAGTESIFAWYDIGKLEFLYITRMPAGQAEKSRLVALRGKFTRRQVGAKTFYVRTTGASDATAPQQANGAETDAAPTDGQQRTVAFATSGDWLLLATREDLMAGALLLLSRSDSNTDTDAKDVPMSLSSEPWFQDVQAAAAPKAGEMRMTLNLEKIVRTPYFRSYWIQHNVSEMKQYRSAVSDLSLNAGSSGAKIFREDRVLLPLTAPEAGGSDLDLARITELLPSHSGAFRAVVMPTTDAAITALNEKLLARAGGSFIDSRSAPTADVQVHPAGEAADLETRIDATPLTHRDPAAELAPLRAALASANLRAMMTVSRTGLGNHSAGDGESSKGSVGDPWVPIQSAIVLASDKEWDSATVQVALQHALAERITTSDLGLMWKPVEAKAGSYLEISETRPLEFAIRGKMLLLSDDPSLMGEMLGRLDAADQENSKGSNTKSEAPATTASANGATLIAGVSLDQERDSFRRWTSLVDRYDKSSSAGDNGRAPGFFSGNMNSLGDVFASLASERVIEKRDGPLTRQTVIYTWRQ
jgi:hypothetical protein